MEERIIRKTIQETIDIVESANSGEENYLTILLNSLLSLVVLPVECIKRKPREKIFGSTLKSFTKATKVTPIKFDPIKKGKNGEIVRCNRTPQNLVNRLRNGVAHQCIDIKECEEERFIIIYNKLGRTKDFEIKITINELRRLELYIARCYLKER